jgi:NTE family protein
VIELPDVLVLGAGGSLGEAWMTGVLGGLGLDFTRCEYFVGTSAGAVVAATLAAGRPPRPVAGAPGDELALVGEAEATAPDDAGGSRIAGALGTIGRGARRVGTAAATPFAPAVLAAAKPAGRLARAAVLRAAKRPERTLPRLHDHVEGLGARFDGRLRVSAVDRASGRRVMFGSPNAPAAAVVDAVLASCAVPWVFAPVEIDGREYVDGGVWSPTNLDAAPAGRGARVLCLMPTAGAARRYRAGTLAAAGAEALALRARGAEVQAVSPDAPTIEAFGSSLLDPRNRKAVAAAGFAQGRRLAAAGHSSAETPNP